MGDIDPAVPMDKINGVMSPVSFPFPLLNANRYGYFLYNLVVG